MDIVWQGSVVSTPMLLSSHYLHDYSSQITQSLKMRDLGVTFDQFLNLDDHVTAIYRSTYFHIRNIGINMIFIV